jgi:hypothetical protein
MVSRDFTHLNADQIQVTEKDTVKFVLDRFSQVKKAKRIRELVEFQAMNKYMLMVHNQEELKILGNLVASHKKIPLSDILDKYEEHLKIALRKEPTLDISQIILVNQKRICLMNCYANSKGVKLLLVKCYPKLVH